MDNDLIDNMVYDYLKKKNILSNIQIYEKIFQRIFETLDEGVIFKDNNGKYIWANKSTFQILGYSFDELNNNTSEISEVIAIDDDGSQCEVIDYFCNISNNEISNKVLHIFRQKSQEDKWIVYNVHPVKLDNDGMQSGALIRFREITDIKLQQRYLLENEKLLRLIAENTSDVIFAMDFDGKINYVSRSIFNSWGLYSEDVINKNIRDIVSSNTSPLLTKELLLLKQQAENNLRIENPPIEIKEVSKNGNIFWSELKLQVMYDDDNEPLGIVGIARNITDWKETELELRKKSRENERIFDYSLDLICYLNKNGNFLKINNEWTKTFGYEKEELMSKNLFNLTHKDDLDSTKIYFSELLNKINQGHFVNRIRCKDGSYKWLEWISFCSDDIIYATARDITERKNQEKLLIESEEKLQESDIMKDKLLSVIAHDLRGMFYSIIGFSELSINEFDNLQKDELISMLNSIYDSATNAHKLLESLLNWSRSKQDKSKFIPEFFCVQSEIQESIKLLNPLLENKNLKIISTIEPGTTAFADKNSFNTIIRNLLSNAIKFSNKDGTIKITSNYKDDFIIISIIDYGIGINRDEIKSLFKIGNTIRNSGTLGEKGTGFGLILCKELVEHNGGEIFVESTPGYGSKFSFSLPFKAK